MASTRCCNGGPETRVVTERGPARALDADRTRSRSAVSGGQPGHHRAGHARPETLAAWPRRNLAGHDLTPGGNTARPSIAAAMPATLAGSVTVKAGLERLELLVRLKAEDRGHGQDPGVLRYPFGGRPGGKPNDPGHRPGSRSCRRLARPPLPASAGSARPARRAARTRRSTTGTGRPRDWAHRPRPRCRPGRTLTAGGRVPRPARPCGRPARATIGSRFATSGVACGPSPGAVSDAIGPVRTAPAAAGRTR